MIDFFSNCLRNGRGHKLNQLDLHVLNTFSIEFTLILNMTTAEFKSYKSESLQKLAHAIYRFFSAVKLENLKNFAIFLNFAQNIDCGFTLEPRF